MAEIVAFYDANVLYPADLRNLLMHLALAGLVRAKWSEDVHEEWISSLLKNRPDLTREKLERTRALMDLHAAGALVTDYDHLIPGLNLPDRNDRHVLAAAIRGHADVIVTANVKDFPRETLRAFGLEAVHPDDFVLELIELAPTRVADAAETHRLSLRNPAQSRNEYFLSLERQGLVSSVQILRRLLP